MTYAKPFFDLQFQFAHRVAALSGVSLACAVMHYTNLHIRFGSGRDFDAAHPIWQQYLVGLRRSNDHGEWTYRFYVARSPLVTPPSLVATFGCFSYSRLSDNHIRLHFQNAETDGRSPLGLERRDHRLARVAREREGGLDVRLVSSDELRVIAPGVAPTARLGAYSPNDGQANPPKTTRAFASAAVARGARYRTGYRTIRLERSGSEIRGVVDPCLPRVLAKRGDRSVRVRLPPPLLPSRVYRNRFPP